MRILVIGGTRFIGAAAVRHLHGLGHEVAVLNRGRSPVEPPSGVVRITGDRADLAASREDIARFAPEVVLHNVIISAEHARLAVEVFRGVAARWVLVSSCDVYRAYGRITGKEPGPPDPLPLTEDSPLRASRYPYRDQAPDPSHPLHDYDKIPAEEIALSDPLLPGTVLRLPMVLGPGDYQHRLFAFLRRMDDQRPAIVLEEGYADWRSTYGFVDNVAACLAQACLDPRATGRVYNVADWDLSMEELARAVAADTGWRGRIVRRAQEALPTSLHAGIETSQSLVVSGARIAAELDLGPRVPLAEAIARTVAWERLNPPDPIPAGTLDYAAEDEVLARD